MYFSVEDHGHMAGMVYGNFDIMFDHFSRIFPALYHLTRAVCHALLCTHTD